MHLRNGVPADAGALTNVFFCAVREGALGPYTETQCAAWAPSRPTLTYWAERTRGLDIVVAEVDDTILGFMAWNARDGDLDMAFVLPEARGTGVADALYRIVENRARNAEIKKLHTMASYLARPFFARHGWTVLRENNVVISDVALTNWAMEKTLV